MGPKCRPCRGFVVVVDFGSHSFHCGLCSDAPPGLRITRNCSITILNGRLGWRVDRASKYDLAGALAFVSSEAGFFSSDLRFQKTGSEATQTKNPALEKRQGRGTRQIL